MINVDPVILCKNVSTVYASRMYSFKLYFPVCMYNIFSTVIDWYIFCTLNGSLLILLFPNDVICPKGVA